MEIYVPIEGYDDYFISTNGNILSEKQHKLLKLDIKKLKERKRRISVDLYKDKKKTTYYVSRLMAITFLNNPDEKKMVVHKNGDIYDNTIKNLIWCTPKESSKKFVSSNKTKGIYARKVIQYSKEGKYLNIFNSLLEAEKITGVSRGNIGKNAKGKAKTAGGFIWKYPELEKKKGEIFKQCVLNGLDTGYQLSNYGRMVNKYNDIIKGTIKEGGYIRVTLRYSKKVETYQMHVLIAKVFIDNIHNYKWVDHINTNKTDNRVSNLKWCTMSQNMNNIITKKLLTNKRI